MPSGARSPSAQSTPKGMMGEIGAGLHVVDAGTEGAVALDLERQPFDEAHGMHGVEMAEHEDAGLVLSPCPSAR